MISVMTAVQESKQTKPLSEVFWMALQKCQVRVYPGLFQGALGNTHLDEMHALTKPLLKRKLNCWKLFSCPFFSFQINQRKLRYLHKMNRKYQVK